MLEEIETREALSTPMLGGDSTMSSSQLSFKSRSKRRLNQYMMFAAMLVCGEFGDKSQITAIVLSATYNPYSVILGGTLALMACAFLAIVLGKFI